MNIRKLLVVSLIIFIGLLIYSGAVSNDDRMQAAVLANPCAGCHGTDGRSTGPVPSINALSSAYIASSMKDFKSDKRTGSVMNRIAKGYTDTEIDLLSRHFEYANPEQGGPQ
jgi:sulfide dehydrogenase cytochrome subunit